MKLIDADALIAQMEADAEHIEQPIAKMFVYAAINEVKHAPTIEERKRGDLISRQAAIDALREIEFSHYIEFGEYIGEDTREVRLIRAEKAQDTIEQLPSAQPDRR